MDELVIRSKIRNFKVKFVDNTNFVGRMLSIPHYAVFVGSVVHGFYKEKIFSQFPQNNLIVMKLGEERKTIATAIKLYGMLMKRSGKKNLTLISFGGGINQDIAGFVASTLYRGINWIYVPTTLLGMADSAIGLKTSLNFGSVKNMVGTFYPPSEVYIDINFLNTLPKKDYASGVGEIMKLLLMGKKAITDLDKIISKIEILNLNQNQTLRNYSSSEAIYSRVEKFSTSSNNTVLRRSYQDKKKIIGIIKEAMRIKLSYMEGDEFDRGRRNLLNYGHELGHALEPVSKYQIPHGTAVVIGMIFANYVSCLRGWLDRTLYQNLNDKLFLPHIAGSMVELREEYFVQDKILGNIKKDKKRISEGLVLILPQKDFGLSKIQDMSINEFRRGLREVRNLLRV